MNQVVMITGPASTAERGWLKPMFPIRGKAHHFARIKGFGAITSQGRAYYWESLCGIDAVSTEKVPMFEAGNWTRCKRCEHQLNRRAAA
ncbi:hypothetical protein D3C77_482930 [compost metagenome]|uniref:hypothetical protein n=1 Tax=Pseudomonas sp. SBB6 TaxID=2962032 RepID=UPI000F90ACB8|nr:hypothetical protein [Pseudomonas sp. SBB6]MCP3750762.1 hypothetical protein [Pseudomonas sp. SBB6]